MMNAIKSILVHLCRCLFGVPDRSFDYPASRPVCNGEFELTEDAVHNFAIGGRKIRITVRRGFRWDGASIPRLFWPVTGHPMDKDHYAGSLFHDALYRSQYLTKEDADWIYAKLNARAGCAYWKVVIELIALWRFGHQAWIADGLDHGQVADTIAKVLITYL